MNDDDKAMWPILYVRGYAMTQGEIDPRTLKSGSERL